MLSNPDTDEPTLVYAIDLAGDAAEWVRLAQLALWGLRWRGENAVLTKSDWNAADLACHHAQDALGALEGTLAELHSQSPQSAAAADNLPGLEGSH